MLVAEINHKFIEVIAIDKTAGKLHQLFHKYNFYINSNNPKERVIYEDSYAQLNTKLTIENIVELTNARKSILKLSNEKLCKLLKAYKNYQKKYQIDDLRKVHMNKEEILRLNEDLLK